MLTIKKIIKYKLWVSSTIALVVALIIIPIVLLIIDIPDPTRYKNEYYSTSRIKIPEGIYIKNADPVVYDFLDDVKRTNGVIVLGTSETGSWMSGKNYYTLLSYDKDLDRTFFALAGAGRLANVYFPLILNNPDAFDGLEVIYYINPTYWRTDICRFNAAYFDRYVDYTVVQNTKDIAKEKGIYKKFMKLTPSQVSSGFTNELISSYKDIFRVKLNLLLKKEDTVYVKVEKQKCNSLVKCNIENHYTPAELEEERKKINLEYNVTDKYLTESTSFPEIDTTSNYQYDLLNAFILLCQDYNINCKFYIGPFNEVYCRKMNPELLEDYQNLIINIKQILISQDVDFIDGTSISNIPGTFSDIQHISEYGAYLTALKIKEYYEKND